MYIKSDINQKTECVECEKMLPKRYFSSSAFPNMCLDCVTDRRHGWLEIMTARIETRQAQMDQMQMDRKLKIAA